MVILSIAKNLKAIYRSFVMLRNGFQQKLKLPLKYPVISQPQLIPISAPL